jgi:hypothetical protein
MLAGVLPLSYIHRSWGIYIFLNFLNFLKLIFNNFFVCVCVVLGFELRAFTLSHSTSHVFFDEFFPDRVS